MSSNGAPWERGGGGAAGRVEIRIFRRPGCHWTGLGRDIIEGGVRVEGSIYAREERGLGKR